MKISFITVLFFIIVCMSYSDETATKPVEVKSDKIVVEFIGDAKYQPAEPLARGKERKPPGGIDMAEKNPVIWGWRIETPDGKGLIFGGMSINTDDPRNETKVKIDGKWVGIRDELCRSNPLQGSHNSLEALRRPLQRITALARHSYLEGRKSNDEKIFLEKEVGPQTTELINKLKAVKTSLAKLTGTNAYITSQISFANSHLEFVLPIIEGLGSSVSSEKLLALRQARIHLELATEALDAEPPARVLSMLVYDSKTGLFALFGGDHFDFLSNDLWVFDPKIKVWQQRHPKNSPEPRAEHFLTSNGDGKLLMRGGYLYGFKNPGWDNATYINAGPDEWKYDLATDIWSGPAELATFPSDTRGYRTGNYLPDFFTSDPRPDADAHEKRLAELPTNTWVSLKPPKAFAWNRDWGTFAFDPDRDLLYWYTGGHSAYSGTDVAHYHLATNRWDQLVETEFAPGFIGTNQPMIGWSFNRRPWMGHQYKSYAYNPSMKKMIMNGRQGNRNSQDQFFYVYDPDCGDWVSRQPTPIFFSRHNAQVIHTDPFGMLTWHGDKIWQLDESTLKWKEFLLKGKLRGTCVDNSGWIFDNKRNRALILAATGYGKPFDGEIYSVANQEVFTFKAEGTEELIALSKPPKFGFNMRESVWHPGLDLIIFNSLLPGGYMPALDSVKNRWVGVKVTGEFSRGVQAGMGYDKKRDLIYIADAYAQVFAMRFDSKTVVIKSLSEISEEVAKALVPVEKK